MKRKLVTPGKCVVRKRNIRVRRRAVRRRDSFRPYQGENDAGGRQS